MLAVLHTPICYFKGARFVLPAKIIYQPVTNVRQPIFCMDIKGSGCSTLQKKLCILLSTSPQIVGVVVMVVISSISSIATCGTERQNELCPFENLEDIKLICNNQQGDLFDLLCSFSSAVFNRVASRGRFISHFLIDFVVACMLCGPFCVPTILK